MAGNKSFISLWRNFSSVFFCKTILVQLCWRVFKDEWPALRSCQSTFLTRPLQIFILFCLFFARSHLLVCLGSLSSCINQMRLIRFLGNGVRQIWYCGFWTLTMCTWWHFHQSSRSGVEAAKQPQNITLSPPCLTVGRMFFFWNGVLVLWC